MRGSTAFAMAVDVACRNVPGTLDFAGPITAAIPIRYRGWVPDGRGALETCYVMVGRLRVLTKSRVTNLHD